MGKALFALIGLTCIPVSALTTIRIGHIDLKEKSVTQNTREVAPKNGKSIETFGVKDSEVAEAAMANWFSYLGSEPNSRSR